jgi:hypothetical protein
MGIPQVGFSHTAPEPADTIPEAGTGTNRTVNHTGIHETRGVVYTRRCFVSQVTKTILESVKHVYKHYSMILTSNESLFLLEPAFTASRTSSNRIRSWRPQEPRQRKAQMDEAWSQLRVNERSWRPCEKTRSTAVDVAMKIIISN